MEFGDLERSFAAWVTNGDVGALERAFDTTAPELMRIALRLAPDLASAEDLVQATFVAALEGARKFDPKRPLVAWLVGILTRQASKARRRGARRVDARDLERERIVDPAARTLEREQVGAIERAIDALPDLYRDVLRRALLDEQRAVEIAAELGRAPGTVRMQLQRGLDLLRAALPPSLASALVLAVPTRGEAAIKSAVLEYAATIGKTSTAFATAGGLIAGGIMSLKLWCAAAAVGLAIGGLYVGFGPDTPNPSESPARVDTAPGPVAPEFVDRIDPSAPVARDAVAESSAGSTGAATNSATPRATDAGWFLVGRVTGLEGHSLTPPPIVVVAIENGSVELSAPLHDDGTYEIDVTKAFESPGDLRNDVEGPRRIVVPKSPRAAEPPKRPFVSASIRHEFVIERDERWQPEEWTRPRAPDERIEIRHDLEARLGSRIIGSVVLPLDTRNRSGVAPEQDFGAVGVVDPKAPATQSVRALAEMGLDASRRFALLVDADGPLEVFACHDRSSPVFRAVTAHRGETVDTGTLTLIADASYVRGFVRAPAGSPVDGSQVYAFLAPPPGATPLQSNIYRSQDLARSSEGYVTTNRTVRCDASGAFEIPVPEGRELSLLLIDIGGKERVLNPPTSTHCVAPATDVVLGENLQRVTLVAERAGAPETKAHIRLRAGMHEHDLGVQDSGSISLFAWRGVDLEAMFTAPGDPPIVLLIPGAARPDDSTWRADFSGPLSDATLVLEAPDGRDVASLRVSLRLVPRDDPSATPIDDIAAGFVAKEATFRGLRPGRYEATVTSASVSGVPAPVSAPVFGTELFDVVLVAKETTTHRLAIPPAGRIRILFEGYTESERSVHSIVPLEVLDERGVRVDRATVGVIPGGWSRVEHHAYLGCENFVDPDLPPGRYTVRISGGSTQFPPQDVAITADKITTVTFRK